jgi:hypothetical protein
MNFIDMRIFFNTAYSVSKNNWLFSDFGDLGGSSKCSELTEEICRRVQDIE